MVDGKDVPDLLSLCVAADDAVYDGRLACLGMKVV